MFGLRCFSAMPTPDNVPPVPTEQVKPSTRPSVWVQIYLSDCMGSGIYNWYARGEWKPEGNSITEGIGNNRETKNLEGFTPDGQLQITDEGMLPVLFRLAQEEGLLVGGSSGINICGAIRLANELGPGHTIVTILADSGTRYQSKLFNPAFLREKNLPTPQWLDG